MDLITVVVTGTIFCALIVSVFMVAYRYNSMTKELKTIGSLLRKQVKSQSAMNAKVLEGIDKKGSSNPKIAAAMAGSGGAGSANELKRITELLSEVIDRLDDMDVTLAGHLTSLDRDGKTTIPPTRAPRAPQEEKTPFVPPISQPAITPIEEPAPPPKAEPVEVDTLEGDDSVEEIPTDEPVVASEPEKEEVPLPPIFQTTQADRGMDAKGWGAMATEEGDSAKNDVKTSMPDMTAIRCPSCARQLPYDALRIQDEQTCPYCLEVFRSNAYLLSLINEGQSKRNPAGSAATTSEDDEEDDEG